MGIQTEIKCVAEFLKENGFVFVVKENNLENSFVDVIRVGKCYQRKIKEVKEDYDLEKFAELSGFTADDTKEFYIYDILEKWWNLIKKICEDKPKYLYLLIKVTE